MTQEQPANYGQSSHGLRGDYSRMRPDYTVDQDYRGYSHEQHHRWRRLYRRQIELVAGRACDEYERALRALPYEGGIPRFEEVTRALGAATGWKLVGVPGLVPDLVFFEHLANRRFPVTVWLREEHEFDYIVEPDVFHDFFGHVPMLFTPSFADYMQAYGEGGLKAARLGALQWLARLYWYTVEFGLIEGPEGLRIYGSGIVSSRAESVYAVESPSPNRIGFDLERVMRTDYRIDDFQESYFVISSFEALFAETYKDFAALYVKLADGQSHRPGDILAGDRVLTHGTHAYRAGTHAA